MCRVAVVGMCGRMESLSFGSDGCFCMLSIIGTDRVENYWQIYDVGIAKQSNLIEVPVLKRGWCKIMSFTSPSSLDTFLAVWHQFFYITLHTIATANEWWERAGRHHHFLSRARCRVEYSESSHQYPRPWPTPIPPRRHSQTQWHSD